MSVNINFDLINKRIRFTTKAPAVLGLTITGRLSAILDAATARTLDDIYAKHTQVYPYLPPGTADDATAYSYLKILKDGTGEIVVIGVPWVDTDSLTVMSSTKAVVDISNIEPSDEDRLKAALLSNGFTNFTIRFKDTDAI